MIPSQTGKRSGKRSLRRKNSTKAESGTCNVCSSPCSSCMHREFGHGGSKVDDFSDAATSQISVVGGDSLQPTASEASNLPVVDSSHDSLSENADSKASIKLSGMVGVSPESENLPKPSLIAEDQLYVKKQFGLSDRTFSNNQEDTKITKGHDDNLSCVTKANDGSKALNFHKKNIDRKTPALVCRASGKAETDKDSVGQPPGETGLQELPSQSLSGEETDDSEIVEHDVKVCDICGDSGREDLLAICTRCTDGAEHTYCMKKMLHRLPKGDWLCEECKLAEENEKQKQDAEGKKVKRYAESMEMASTPKKQAVETDSASPGSSSPSRVSALSRESSLKLFDDGKARSANHIFSRNQTSNVAGNAHTSSTGQGLESQKGTLLKSNTFNSLTSKPKVKLDEVPEKHKGVVENYSLDVGGRAKLIGKSMSFKLANSGRSSANESKVKMLPSNFSHVQEIKGLKQVKDRNTFERKNSSKTDCRLAGMVTASSKDDQKVTPSGDIDLPCASNNQELNIAESDDCMAVTSAPTEVSVARITKEQMSKGTKLKAAIEAAMLKKPGLYRKKKESDQCDGLSSSKVEAGGETASQDEISFSHKRKAMVFDEGINGGKASPGPFSSDSWRETNIDHMNHRNSHSTDCVFPLKVEDSDSIVSAFGKCQHASASSIFLTSVIPEPEYIWQGAFEISRNGKSPDLFVGFQAHLATCASPKVLEVVKSFPQKIILDEVLRLSTWPRQFHDTGAKEDNIALYFFAKDLECYERNYKGLLDHLTKRDLALKGSFDGVEFMIFSSIQLPENSQCWNMLPYLWGVFRGKRSGSSDVLKMPVIPNSDRLSQGKEVSSAVTPLPDDHCMSECIKKENSVFDSSDNAPELNASDKPYVSLDRNPNNNVSNLQASSEDSKVLSNLATSSDLPCAEEGAELSNCRLDSEDKASSQNNGANSCSNSRTEAPMHANASHVGKHIESLSTPNVCSQNLSSRGNVAEDDIADRKATDVGRVKIEIDLNESDVNIVTDAEEDGIVQGTNGLSDIAPQASNSIIQTVNLNKVDGVSLDEKSICKKQKNGLSESYGSSSLEDGNSSQGGFTSQKWDLGSSSSVEGRSCNVIADKKVILEDLGTTERYFFPVGSHHEKNFNLGGNMFPWKESSSNGVPNLELALGAEAKSQNKKILPFLVGMAGKDNNQQSHPDNLVDKREDGLPGSLSLSLSFLSSDKDQIAKPVSKTEQLLPERRHVNTSLLLFKGLSDK